MSLRNRELLHLLLVGVLTGLGFASVYIAQQEIISTASLTYLGFFLGLYLAAHVVTRIALPFADPYLLPLAALLTGIGLTMIYRIEPELALRQGVWLVVGIGVFAVCALLVRDYRSLDHVKWILGTCAVVLLVLPAVPGLGETVNGSSLWIELGPIRFQPGEVAKVLMVVFLAGYLRDKREVLTTGLGRFGLPPLKHFGPLLVIWGAAMLVLFQTNDLGGGLLYFSVFLAMLYLATARWQYVAVGTLLFAAGAYGLYHVVPHVQDRVQIWLDPWHDPYDTGYQLVQSIYAISSGGLFGTGLGRGVLIGTDGTTYIPFLQTDFIYSALAQELGLAGGAAVIVLYIVLVYRGLRIAMLADDGFSKLLAAGLTATIGIQAFIILGGVTGLIPLTGITLPFVSYGGSSLVANFVVLWLLLAVSNRVNARSAGR
ncbi:MAG: FtsW/RodA/SpoVE family cell cycle protein [Gaiellales bacterium]